MDLFSQKKHKSTRHPLNKKERQIKAKFQALTLHRLERFDKASGEVELKFDTTPEGIVAFEKYLVELLGQNKIDTGRVSAINFCVQNILRTNESGLDAVKELEESTSHLAKTLRTTARVH